MCLSNEDFEHSEIIQSLWYSWTPPIFTFTTLLKWMEQTGIEPYASTSEVASCH